MPPGRSICIGNYNGDWGGCPVCMLAGVCREVTMSRKAIVNATDVSELPQYLTSPHACLRDEARLRLKELKT